MNLYVQVLIASLITVAGASGEAVPLRLKVTNDGAIRSKPTLGETNWSGSVEVEHPRFRLVVQGLVSQFSGPSIRKTSPPGTALRREDLAVEFQWISLVAIGDIQVTVIGPTGPAEPIKAKRFVYVAKDDRILIDGVPWDGKGLHGPGAPMSKKAPKDQPYLVSRKGTWARRRGRCFSPH